MKRLLLVAASVIGLASTLLAERIARRKKQENQKPSRDMPLEPSSRNRTMSSRLAVQKDGSLQLHRVNTEGIKKNSSSNYMEIHLKKNGEPDRRYKENRDY